MPSTPFNWVVNKPSRKFYRKWFIPTTRSGKEGRLCYFFQTLRNFWNLKQSVCFPIFNVAFCFIRYNLNGFLVRAANHLWCAFDIRYIFVQRMTNHNKNADADADVDAGHCKEMQLWQILSITLSWKWRMWAEPSSSIFFLFCCWF